MKFKYSTISLALISTLLAACGSNDSKKDILPPPPQNVAPVVTLDSPVTVDSFTLVTLNAIATDSDGTIDSYSWQQTGGYSVSLNTTDTETLEFEAPEITGHLEFTVTVVDDDGASSYETVTVGVTGPLVGSWARDGYHQYVTVGIESVDLLQYTPNANQPGTGWCYKGFELDTDELQEIAPVTFSQDFQSMSFDPIYYGDDDGTRYYKKAVELPLECQNGGMFTAEDNGFTGDARDDFQILWHAFNAHYPFFSLRNKDWQQEYDSHVDLVTSSTTAEQLADIFSSMLENISDGHVAIYLDDEELDIDGNLAQFPIYQRIYEQFQQQLGSADAISDFWDYYYERFDVFNDIISENYVELDQIEELAEESLMAWGKFTYQGQGNIGYIRIGTFATEGDTEEEYQDYIEKLDAAMEALKTTDSMVIDVRLNGGGSERLAFYLANYFADQKRHVLDKQVQDINGLTEPVAFYIEPHADKMLYHKPVRVLTDSWSGSAAETFAIMMRSLEMVKIVGERSAGDTASQLSKILPFSGMNVNIPNTVYTSYDNKVFENVGVEVDIEVLDFTAQDLINETDAVLDAALESLY